MHATQLDLSSRQFREHDFHCCIPAAKVEVEEANRQDTNDGETADRDTAIILYGPSAREKVAVLRTLMDRWYARDASLSELLADWDADSRLERFIASILIVRDEPDCVEEEYEMLPSGPTKRPEDEAGPSDINAAAVEESKPVRRGSFMVSYAIEMQIWNKLAGQISRPLSPKLDFHRLVAGFKRVLREARSTVWSRVRRTSVPGSQHAVM